MITPAEASRRLIASESMNDLALPKSARHSGIDLDEQSHRTPPGTPPPPYPLPNLNDTTCSNLSNVSFSYSYCNNRTRILHKIKIVS